MGIKLPFADGHITLLLALVILSGVEQIASKTFGIALTRGRGKLRFEDQTCLFLSPAAEPDPGKLCSAQIDNTPV